MKINFKALGLLSLFVITNFIGVVFAQSIEQGIGIAYNPVTGKNEVRAVNLSNGRTRLLNSFKFDSGNWKTGSFSVDAIANRFYVISGANTLYEFNLTTGAIISTKPLDKDMQAIEVFTRGN